MQCNTRHIIVLVVPGRDDRVFYKVFFRRLAEILSECCRRNISYIDLDSGEYRAEKRKLVERIVPGGRGLERWAAISLINSHERCVNVLIGLPSIEALRDVLGEETRIRDPVAAATAAVIGALAARRMGGISLLVAADDAEEHRFADRLRMLEDAVFNTYLPRFHLEKALEGAVINRSVIDFDQDGYYKLLEIVVHSPSYSSRFKLLLLVQGLEAGIIGNISPLLAHVEKRALEDLIVYAAKRYASKVPDECLNLLLGKKRGLHKKIVRLLVLMLCHYELESAMGNLLNTEGVRRLLDIHKGLLRLASEAAAQLECRLTPNC